MTKYPDPDFLRPGSTAALDAGCLCPVLDNEYGQGYEMQPGVFVYNGDCPIHGIKGSPEIWAKDPVDTAAVKTGFAKRILAHASGDTYRADLADIKRLIDRYGSSGLMNIAATIHLRMRPYCPSWVKEPASDDEIVSLMRSCVEQELS